MRHLVRLSHASPFSPLHSLGFIPRQRMEETRAELMCLQSSYLSSMVIQAAWILHIQKIDLGLRKEFWDPVGTEIRLTHAYFL
uniref:5-hydroxytryptamine receptor 4 n=1 Tax=Cercocebus atys TaxID=9531 RepID=A0A2K5MD04_CERAT